ncbi:MAG TPA: hypothetical protein GXX28_02390 [Firmicutes bacterium]|nr:hypothetical protein [Bacillota bacterium]
MGHRPARLMSVVCLAALLGLMSTSRVQGTGWTWLTVSRLEKAFDPGLSGALVVGAPPVRGVAALSGDLVSLYRIEADGRFAAEGSFLTDAPWSAAALGDVDADGRWEIIGARGEEGALTVDRWVNGQRIPLGAARYSWARIDALYLAATGSGRTVVAAPASGGIISYLVGGKGLEPAGITEPGQRFRLFGVGDLDGDGYDELVAGSGRSELSVFRWDPEAGWIRWWQNYPWGGVLAAVVSDLDDDGRPEVAVVSGERLVYVFSGNEGRTGLALRWQGTVALPMPLLGVTALPPLSSPEKGPAELVGGLVLYGRGEVHTLRFSPDLTAADDRAWILPWLTEAGGLPGRSPGDLLQLQLLTRFADGTLAAVGVVPSERLQLLWSTAEREETPVSSTLVRNGRLYVGLREISARLSLDLSWDETQHVTKVKTPVGRTVEVAAGRAMRAGGESIPGTGRPVEEGGRLYLEARDVARVFPPEDPKAPRLVVALGDRRWPATDLW